MFAQGPITHKQIARNQVLLTIGMERLTGKVEHVEEVIDLLSASVTEEDIQNAFASAFHLKVANQKESFKDILLQMICENYEQDCETRNRVEALERRVDEFQNRHNVQKPISPSQPRSYMAPSDEYVVHRITSNRKSLCPNATLLAKCMDHRLADGRVYHGDLFLDCAGNQVLVQHRQSNRR